SQLRQETGSTRQALKGLGNALLGSGGLFLGTSLLISGITLLTQKYGSLGNAWDVLTGKASALYNKQKQLNKVFEKASGLKSYLETSIRLGVELDSVSSGVVSQSKFLKDYNKIIKDSSEKFDNFNAAQQDFLNNNDDIIKAYVKQALYQQLIQKAAGLSTKLIENQKKEASEFVNIWDIIWANIKSQNKHVLRGSFMQEVFSGIGKTAVKNKKEEIKGLKDAIKTAMKDSKAAYKEFLELLKKNNLDKYFF